MKVNAKTCVINVIRKLLLEIHNFTKFDYLLVEMLGFDFRTKSTVQHTKRDTFARPIIFQLQLISISYFHVVCSIGYTYYIFV